MSKIKTAIKWAVTTPIAIVAFAVTLLACIVIIPLSCVVAISDAIVTGEWDGE